MTSLIDKLYCANAEAHLIDDVWASNRMLMVFFMSSLSSPNKTRIKINFSFRWCMSLRPNVEGIFQVNTKLLKYKTRNKLKLCFFDRLSRTRENFKCRICIRNDFTCFSDFQKFILNRLNIVVTKKMLTFVNKLSSKYMTNLAHSL